MLCRGFLLIIIIVIAVYFIYENDYHISKGHDKAGKETFEENTVIEQTFRLSIMSTYNRLLKRDPEEFEVMKARGILNSDADMGPLEAYLKGSDEYKLNIRVAAKKTELDDLKPKEDTEKDELEMTFDVLDSTDLGKRMNIYRSIVHVYENNYERLPNMKELNYYTYRILTDSSFNVDRLESILQSSKEYEILIKNQKNNINATLPGNITDAQVTYEVRKMHQELFKNLPSKEMEEFLKMQFVHYQLDPEKLQNLMKLLEALDDTNAYVTFAKDEICIKKQVKCGPLKKQVVSNKTLATNDKTLATNDKTLATDATSKKCAVPYNMHPYKDELYETIRNEANAKPQKTNGQPSDRNLLAEYSMDRNIESLGLECSRNSQTAIADNTFAYAKKPINPIIKTNVDDIFIPSNYDRTFGKQQIGTPLDDASYTRVGSIMPMFIYKEYTP
jgi:hypothetical protein